MRMNFFVHGWVEAQVTFLNGFLDGMHGGGVPRLNQVCKV